MTAEELILEWCNTIDEQYQEGDLEEREQATADAIELWNMIDRLLEPEPLWDAMRFSIPWFFRS